MDYLRYLKSFGEDFLEVLKWERGIGPKWDEDQIRWSEFTCSLLNADLLRGNNLNSKGCCRLKIKKKLIFIIKNLTLTYNDLYNTKP